MKFAWLFLVLVGISIASDVVVLTDENFDETIKSNELVFVEFYAPWCGHCKQLAPAYEEVATELKDRVVIAKVDGTENKELMGRFAISGFPTLKFFVGGAPVDYNAGRTKKDIIAWIEKKIAPVTTLNTKEEFDNFVAKSKVAVAFVSSDTSTEYGEYKKIALSFDSYKFGVVFSDEVRGENALNSIKLYRGFDTDIVNTNFNSETLTTWINEHGFPLIDVFGSESFQRIQGKYSVLVFGVFDVNSSPESHKELVDILNTLCAEFKSKDIGCMIADTKSLRADALGASGKFLPTLAGYNTKKTSSLKIPDMFAWDETTPITLDSARTWFNQIVDGNVVPFKKSQPVPENNDGPVKILVAKNFAEITKGKNALVEYYAPWCGHCKNLEPIYNELGTLFVHNDNIVIAKMDAIDNWIDYQVQGFPTIVLYKENGTKVQFDGGDRNIENLVKFINTELGIKPKSQGDAHIHDDL